MKWLRCSAVSAVQYCHCVVHCVANEPSRSFTTTTALSLLKASTSASKSRGASIGPSLWALWQLRGPSCPALVRCAVTPVSGGWHHYARLVAGGGYTANIILITRVASEGTLAHYTGRSVLGMRSTAGYSVYTIQWSWHWRGGHTTAATPHQHHQHQAGHSSSGAESVSYCRFFPFLWQPR